MCNDSVSHVRSIALLRQLLLRTRRAQLSVSRLRPLMCSRRTASLSPTRRLLMLLILLFVALWMLLVYDAPGSASFPHLLLTSRNCTLVRPPE